MGARGSGVGERREYKARSCGNVGSVPQGNSRNSVGLILELS